MSETNIYFYSALAIVVFLIACVIFFKRSTARSTDCNKVSISIFMGFGTALGIIFGVVLGNIVEGVVIGMLVGVGVGWLSVFVRGRRGGGPSD
ncbi:MAG: hypothetical protein HOC20_14035 [Chloroflexi bacterium]|jgi:hypothetical protein|nr:hypothetical protein [Chloroflexota bacterium]